MSLVLFKVCKTSDVTPEERPWYNKKKTVPLCSQTLPKYWERWRYGMSDKRQTLILSDSSPTWPQRLRWTRHISQNLMVRRLVTRALKTLSRVRSKKGPWVKLYSSLKKYLLLREVHKEQWTFESTEKVITGHRVSKRVTPADPFRISRRTQTKLECSQKFLWN